MIAGTIGATVIALFTVPLGRALIGEDGANAYPAAAAGFAALATLIVFAALARYRDDPHYCLTTRQPTLGSLLIPTIVKADSRWGFPRGRRCDSTFPFEGGLRWRRRSGCGLTSRRRQCGGVRI